MATSMTGKELGSEKVRMASELRKKKMIKGDGNTHEVQQRKLGICGRLEMVGRR